MRLLMMTTMTCRFSGGQRGPSASVAGLGWDGYPSSLLALSADVGWPPAMHLREERDDED